MDGQHLDRIARSLASGMSRRGAMKGIAAAVGLAAMGARSAPTAANSHRRRQWQLCGYDCSGTAYPEFCEKGGCRTSIEVQGAVCTYNYIDLTGPFSKPDCEQRRTP